MLEQITAQGRPWLLAFHPRRLTVDRLTFWWCLIRAGIAPHAQASAVAIDHAAALSPAGTTRTPLWVPYNLRCFLHTP